MKRLMLLAFAMLCWGEIGLSKTAQKFEAQLNSKPVGAICWVNAECASGRCGLNNRCRPVGGSLKVDLGSTTLTSAPVGAVCWVNAQCASGRCGHNNRCRPVGGANKVNLEADDLANTSLQDVNFKSSRKPNGAICWVNAECSSGRCGHNNRCRPVGGSSL